MRPVTISAFCLGKGDGTFQAEIAYSVGTSGTINRWWSYFSGGGRLQWDGRADLAVANSSTNNVSILLGLGPPAVNSGGIVNGASFSLDGFVSPGSLVSLFGVNLSPATPVAAFPLPLTLAGTQVLVNGTAAPLIYVSSTQINFQMPNEVVATEVSVVAVTTGVRTPSVTAKILPQAPGIFTTASNGTGQGAVLNQDFSPNSAQNPVSKNSVIQVFLTGLGATNPPLAAGQAGSPVEPFNRTVNAPVVQIGGITAEVAFSGAAPGFVGLYQVNARIPAGAASGDTVSLQIVAGGRASNTVTIAIR